MTEQTVEIEGFGPVTIKPLGKVAMLRLREAARRGGVHGSEDIEARLRTVSAEQAIRWREDALLLGPEHVIAPRYDADEFARVFAGREHLIPKIADAIREASWPNR